MRNHLIELQKKSFKTLQAEILDQRRFEDGRITRYRKKYLQEVQDYQKISSKSKVFNQILKSKIIFCGDFHTLSRSQVTALKILQFLRSKNQKIILALEMVPRIYEPIANDYVQGKYQELTFLKLIHYEKVWGFPWSHYKPLFDFAKEHQLPILGVNTPDAGYQTLQARDKCAAKALFNASQKYKDHTLFCLYGDLHVADAHIPQQCKKLFMQAGQEMPRMTTIFQNSDAIYWKLVDQGLDHKVDVVEISPHQFCVLSSTPWVKWQSYQTWLEDHSVLIDDVDTQEWDLHQMPDYFHITMEYKKLMHQFLKLDFVAFENLQVYSSHDIEVTNIVNKYVVNAKKRVDPIFPKMIEIEMIENRSLFLPNVPLIYLQDVSPNKIAQKASQLIAFQLSPDFCIYDPSFSKKEHFYRLALIECIGFFGAKVVNPKKKTSHLKDFIRFLEKIKRKRLSEREKLKKQAALWVLKHHESFEIKRTRIDAMFEQPPRMFFLCARAIGRMLGDFLYLQAISEKTSLKEIRQMYQSFSKDQSCEKVFTNFFAQLVQTSDSSVGKDDLF